MKRSSTTLAAGWCHTSPGVAGHGAPQGGPGSGAAVVPILAPVERSKSLNLSRALPRPFVTRRRLQLALALLWILDGALQLQPFMFTRGFADRVISPAAVGQPELVATAVHWSASLISGNPFVWGALFAATQLAIGAALLFRRTARLAIVVSVAWSMGVWVLGEGLGGMAGGTSTFLTGAPGAVVLYALIGSMAWPRLGAKRRSMLTSRRATARTRLEVLFAPADDESPAAWTPVAWATLWAVFALLQALAAARASDALPSQLRSSLSSSPAWLAHTDRVLATLAAHGGAWPAVGLIVVEVTIGLLGLRGGTRRSVAAAIGIGMALGVWVLGQAFGQIPSGAGTDPSSGPLVVLLGIALWGSRRTRDARVTSKMSEPSRPAALSSSARTRVA